MDEISLCARLRSISSSCSTNRCTFAQPVDHCVVCPSMRVCLRLLAGGGGSWPLLSLSASPLAPPPSFLQAAAAAASTSTSSSRDQHTHESNKPTRAQPRSSHTHGSNRPSEATTADQTTRAHTDPPAAMSSSTQLHTDHIDEYFSAVNMHRRPHHTMPTSCKREHGAEASSEQAKTAPSPQPGAQPPRADDHPPVLHPALDDTLSVSSASSSSCSSSDSCTALNAASTAAAAADLESESPLPMPFEFHFASMLKSLTWTDPVQISALTHLADTNRDKASLIVRVMRHHMLSLPGGDYRLPLMSLIDSICLNLGSRGTDYLRRLRLDIQPMLSSMMKRCTPRIKAILYRMVMHWKEVGTFDGTLLASLEELMHTGPHALSEQERTDALAPKPASSRNNKRPRSPPTIAIAIAVPSPSSLAVSPPDSPMYEDEIDSEPVAKRAVLLDPRRSAAAVATPEATALLQVLSHPDITSRVDLQQLVASMHIQLRLPLPEEEMKALVANLVQQLTAAYGPGQR